MSRSREDPYVGILLLEVVECKDLPKMDTFGSADPYVVLRFGTHNRFVTETIYNTLNPQWKQSFKILVTKSEEKYNVEFEVFDWDKNSKNDEVGTAVVPISSFLAKTAPNDIWVDLHASKSKRSVGKLHVRGVLKDQKTVESEFWNELAKEFDSDNNQKISFVEFVTLIHTVNPKADEKSILDLAGAAGLDKAEISFDFFCNLMCGDEANLKKNPALAAILTPNSRDFIWEVCSTMNSIGEKILEGGFYGKVESSAALALVEREKIVVHDRKTGKLVDEKIPEYIWTSLNLMYQSKSGRFAVSSKRVAGILKHLSEKQGKRYNNPDSKKEIAKFIDFHNLNKDEMLESLDSFKNFNEFFFRKLKPSARPISEATNSSRAVSAADCRLHVFESVDFAKNIWIKGKNFSLVGLLQNTQIARNYEGGSLCIFRLAPQDYHRFHSPVDGELLEFVEMAGTYYTVNPVAVRTQTDVYTENKRCRLTIKSPQFGEVIFVAIGATMVGSINWTRKKGDKIKKGDELGYFAFGGSTIIVLFKKDTIKFDNDLVVNSKKPIETLVHMGESLGISCGKK